MKKTFALLLASALSLGALAGCTPAGTDDEDNVAPVISGVANTATTVAGEEFDALEGVTASDAEDGDLTASVTVESIPDLTFTDGVATPSMPGSYELIYSVVDSDGAEGNAYCTLTVTRAAAEAKELYSFDFSEVTPAESDKRGWTASIDESVDGTAELRQGAYVFDIASLGTAGDGSVTLNKVIENPVAGDYELFVWAKSTVPTYMHVIAEDASTDDWKGIGGGYNLMVGEKTQALSAKFTLGEDNMTDALDLRLHMGKITPNPENPADTSADAFSLSIEKIALYCTTGTETRVDLYSQTFDTDASSVTTQAGDGAAASVSAEDGAAKVDIASYHDEGAGGVWSLKVDLSLANVVIEEGAKYGYSLKVAAESAQAGELLVESRDAGVRANFNSFSVAAGETKEVTGVFTAEAGIASDPVLRFQIGNPEAGVTSNVLTLDDLVFYRLDGDKRTDRTLLDRFLLFGAGSSNELNEEKPYEVFNGSDDSASQLGIGTMYVEDGKLVYHIEEAGEADWHNKLVLGYKANPLVLPGNSYYTFRIKIKASAPVTFNFYVHDLNAIDWDSGLLVRENGVSIGTEEVTLEYTTTNAPIGESDYEMLFQFGSAALAAIGDVVIEVSEITVLQSELI